MNETFKEYLQNQNLSQNTIISYTSTLEQYHNQFHTFTRKNLREYKYFLMENYKPQTVNLRIRAINCYLESIHKEQWKLSGVKVQQKPFLENVISEADYLYFKNCLKQDQEMYWYFVVRFLAANRSPRYRTDSNEGRTCANGISGSLFKGRKIAQNLYSCKTSKRNPAVAF